ncbi:hypothetical protein MINT15_35910 [Saccharomonospora viridis]|uniref:Uncharacterized protein n=1 Tax=Saccharomonospora viridis TaxID=1852 RepID=A0A837D6E9_9PSEU|nr:hypothetical protein MINT15_35910 [Saccharomonospora viridis]
MSGFGPVDRAKAGDDRLLVTGFSVVTVRPPPRTSFRDGVGERLEQ